MHNHMPHEVCDQCSCVCTVQHSHALLPHKPVAQYHLTQAYRRAGKIVFAEGLYRECLKLCGMPKDAAAIPADTSLIPPPPTHPSIPGMAAWRLAQLLSALPNRDTEVGQFARLAQGLLGGEGSAEVLGSLRAFSGKTQHKGAFAIISLWTMRMFVAD